MPTYRYLCKECGHELEEFQQMKDDPLTECPNCKKDSLVRVMGAGAGVIFKGSGFYLTDYKNKSKAPTKKKEKQKKKDTGDTSKGESTGQKKDDRK